MVLPDSGANFATMILRSVLFMAIVGYLGVTALEMQRSAESPALTLEHGLGPTVETTRL